MIIRQAKREDLHTIFDFIVQLARYEKMENQVVGDEKTLDEWLFEKKKAEVLLCENENGKTVGFALYFYNFSTFLTRAGIYLEDLFVIPDERGRGYGKALITALAKKANDEGYGRLEWWCLNWNKPSIDFYLSLGAEPMKDWTVYRISGDNLKKFK